MPVTLREVAAAAGVSTAAVSKVLHGRGKSVRVSPERALQIRKIAEDLNYRPNALARNLRTRKTHTVGLIFENFGSITGGPMYYIELLDGVASVLFKNHYRLTLLPELAHDDVPGSLGDGQLDGVIWCKLARDEATLNQIHDCPIPIVAMNAPAPERESDAVFVACDNEGGIELAVAHLWDLGHRRIMFLHEHEEADTPDCIARREAFVSSMSRRGVDARADALSWGWSLQDFEAWWASNPPHTGVICWSESLAGRFIARATELGLNVPADFSVMGFDSTPYCDQLSPRLTAVRQPILEMAAKAAATLLDLLAGNRPASFSLTFPCTLDVRDSTTRPSQCRVGS